MYAFQAYCALTGGDVERATLLAHRVSQVFLNLEPDERDLVDAYTRTQVQEDSPEYPIFLDLFQSQVDAGNINLSAIARYLNRHRCYVSRNLYRLAIHNLTINRFHAIEYVLQLLDRTGYWDSQVLPLLK